MKGYFWLLSGLILAVFSCSAEPATWYIWVCFYSLFANVMTHMIVGVIMDLIADLMLTLCGCWP